MSKPTKPTDVLVTNGWYLELPGLNSPHFQTLDGIKIASGTVGITDGGSNKTSKFSDQTIEFGNMSLTRPKQGNADDIALNALVTAMITTGLKVDCRAVKVHNKQVAFTIFFEGFRFSSRTLPTFDTEGNSKFMEAFEATCDEWTEL